MASRLNKVEENGRNGRHNPKKIVKNREDKIRQSIMNAALNKHSDRKNSSKSRKQPYKFQNMGLKLNSGRKNNENFNVQNLEKSSLSGEDDGEHEAPKSSRILRGKMRELLTSKSNNKKHNFENSGSQDLHQIHSKIGKFGSKRTLNSRISGKNS